MGKIFYSKIDKSIFGIYFFLMAVCLIVIYSIATSFSASFITLFISLPFIGLGIVLPAWMLLGTYYQIIEDVLLVRSGPFKWRISFDSIKSITNTRDPISSPALSLDRLRIEYGQYKSILISPKEKDLFLSTVKQLTSARVA